VHPKPAVPRPVITLPDFGRSSPMMCRNSVPPPDPPARGMPFFDPTLLLLGQLAEHLAQVPPQLPIQHSSPALGDEHNVIFALPLGMA